ncbi:MAG: DUF3467 domain-containing protein [Candidatus Latescibacteria bacterium]|nr:DUF3467 domain-containing protein [bacterium]MBD3425477.1 DUF3467 domain-containing protein [Candidatus Latescibacterota bacterium]
MKKKQQQIQIELPQESADGTYSNFVLTTHTASEFVLDFARMLPGLQKAKVHSRIIMTPQAAKSLLNMLGRTIEGFEERFGEIEIKGRKGAESIGFQPGSDMEN